MEDECLCSYLVMVRGFWICSFKISDAIECPLGELGKCLYARGPFKPELNT